MIEEYDSDRLKYFINPKTHASSEIKAYYNNLVEKKPEYLLPLDGWLSIIIYPTLEVKNAANCKEIQELIMKAKKIDLPNPAIKSERESMPIQLDLDICGHF
jgi:hypothetical protein